MSVVAARKRKDREAPSRRLVRIGFALIATGVLASTTLALVQAQTMQTENQELVENMLTSVRLLGELKSGVEERRILVDDHIFASEAIDMDRLEAKIREVDGKVGTEMRAYDPWATLPGERAMWRRIREELASLDEPMARALALSRHNKDVEARRTMEQVGAEFSSISQHFDALTAINDRAANESVTRTKRIRSHLKVVLFAIGLVGLALTLIVGTWASGEVARREKDLKRHALALEARNRELDAFSGRVAHDIRGPLSSIHLALQTLGTTNQSDRRGLEILGRAARRMEALIDDLLTLARSETPIRGRCDPAVVASDVQGDFRARIEADQGNLSVTVAHEEVSCSEGLLRQSIANLLENAVKYRRPEEALRVDVSGATVGDAYDLRVSDNGIGMSTEEAARAFEPFYRSPRMRDLPGTGLGLSIVKRVAEAVGGNLSVQTTLGEGSTFVMRIPLADKPASADSQTGV